MLNKCFVSINDINERNILFEGVAEKLPENELNIYIDSSDDADTQSLISYIHTNADCYPSLTIEAPNFRIICWDCFIKCSLMESPVVREEGKKLYLTPDSSMICIGCNSWIDYPVDEFREFKSFDDFLLDEGAINLRNLGKWNTIGNNGKYNIRIDYKGINFQIGRFLAKVQYPRNGVEEDIPQLFCGFEKNTKYKLPELIALLASLRDFFAFVTGRYIQINDVNNTYSYGHGHYKLIFHVDYSAYYPAIEDEVSWGENNITISELEKEGYSNLFSKWQTSYEQNSYPLSFFNRTNKEKLTPRQYITEIIVAFDSFTDKRKSEKLKKEYIEFRNDIYNSFSSRFPELHLAKEDIKFDINHSESLKSRVLNAISECDMHFYNDGMYLEAIEVAEMLKNIRNSIAHGKEIKHTQNIKPRHYYALGNFCENLLIRYIRKKVFGLKPNPWT